MADTDTHAHGPDEHSHDGGTVPHDHDAVATAGDGHDHDEVAGAHDHSAVDAMVVPAAIETGVGSGGAMVRIVLTLLGAAAMIAGAFLAWYVAPGDASVKGTQFPTSVLWDPEVSVEASLLSSAGFVPMVLGGLAVLGLAFRSGWLTRLAGALGILTVAAFVVTLYRVADFDLSVSNLGIGAWIVAGGSLLALIAGFIGTRPKIVATGTPVAA